MVEGAGSKETIDHFNALIREGLAKLEEARMAVYAGPLPAGVTTTFTGASLNRLDEAIYQLRHLGGYGQ